MAHRLNWQMPELELLNSLFSPPLTKSILSMKVYREERSFYWVVKECAQRLSKTNLDLTSPTSVQHFLSVMEPILSRTAKEQIADNIAYFNYICESDLAEAHLSEVTFGQWFLHFVETVITSTHTQPPTSITSSTTYASTRHSTARSTPPPTHEKPIPGFDGADEHTQKPKVTQVTLRGASILSAWRNNETVVDPRYNATLRKLEEIFGLAKNAKPDESGGPNVFHGTTAHFKEGAQQWPDSWENSALNLHPASNGCQMNPPGVGVAYTSFSPLRAFLWAAFQGTIYQNIPSRDNINFMNKAWTSQGRPFRGVALFGFDATTPAPQSLTWAMVPEREGATFSSRVESLRTSGSFKGSFWTPNDAWARLRETVGNESEAWPDLLHSKEFGQQQRDLSGFQCNLWRTCWLEGKALDVLNRSYKFTVAIEFVYVPKPAPPPKAAMPVVKEPKKKDDKDGDEGKGGWKSLRHKLSKLSLGKNKRSGGQA
ncbi:hypothetical protein AA0119_g1226 [Alternaria tenuissima]|uniref:Uncharacterized protein n=1 Tax=Alternaria tenuissima TaxID=119927 RepID=A0A4Q4PTZ5_9PLEO|nr:hypothetical protein AA0115_g2206 [Alternaria tenuissima]RYO08665.1 hypothetical protein AA0119_g1226 [Alternaria tenuissima]RYO22224.1 hypothetical protein AA0121_g2494 [Alternaria tenuissima]RYO65954.1 hypothetical protein AA0116_g2581 [Alternaria tenuissima]